MWFSHHFGGGGGGVRPRRIDVVDVVVGPRASSFLFYL